MALQNVFWWQAKRTESFTFFQSTESVHGNVKRFLFTRMAHYTKMKRIWQWKMNIKYFRSGTSKIFNKTECIVFNFIRNVAERYKNYYDACSVYQYIKYSRSNSFTHLTFLELPARLGKCFKTISFHTNYKICGFDTTVTWVKCFLNVGNLRCIKQKNSCSRECCSFGFCLYHTKPQATKTISLWQKCKACVETLKETNTKMWGKAKIVSTLAITTDETWKSTNWLVKILYIVFNKLKISSYDLPLPLTKFAYYSTILRNYEMAL